MFVGNDSVPSWVTKGNGEDYSVARVLMEDNITLPPESECLAWGKVENPKPGLPAVLKPLNITETVSSRSVAIYMNPRIPVRLCNFSNAKASLPRGVCVGILIETFPDDPLIMCDSESDQLESTSEEECSETSRPMVGSVRKCNRLTRTSASFVHVIECGSQ